MERGMLSSIRISHWLPIVTFCPVNKLPDVIYVTVEFPSFAELYAVRKRIRKLVSWKLCFMEDVAAMLRLEFPDATEIRVTLLTGRHVVIDRRRL
jgi:hypothetical protein